MKIIHSLIFFSLQLPALAVAGIYSHNLWERKEISVCFAGPEKELRIENGHELKIKNWKKRDKKNIEFWVNEEFSPERTGIHFVGWKSCTVTTESDVVLFYNSNSYVERFVHGGLDGLAGDLGPRRVESVSGFPWARSMVAISKTGMNKGTAIHEFGHVAGLAHEHNHYDAPKYDKSCPHYRPTFSRKLEYTTFDPASIMSYCSLRLKKLSDGDVNLLKKIYP